MADEESDEEGFNSEGFDVVRDLPAFLASVLDKTEYICQNDVDEGTAEAHAEVIDQSIRLLRSIRDCYDIGTSEKEELDSLAAAFADVLSSLILTSPLSLSPQQLLLKIVLPQEKRKRKLLEDHVLTFLLRCWKNCENWDSVGLRLEKCWVFRGGRFIGE